jgi:hypothetical protein
MYRIVNVRFVPAWELHVALRCALKQYALSGRSQFDFPGPPQRVHLSADSMWNQALNPIAQ